jgi:hypothetical protein
MKGIKEKLYSARLVEILLLLLKNKTIIFAG